MGAIRSAAWSASRWCGSGEFESGMSAIFLGAMPAVVLGSVGTIDVGRSLP